MGPPHSVPDGRRSASIVRRSASFRWFWSARAVSYTGDGIALIALLLYVQEAEATGISVGLVVLAGTAPRLLGPFAGTVADRVDQRRLMVACDLGQATVYALIALTLPPFAALLALVALAGALATLFGPAGRSALPALVGRDDLLEANSWLGTAFNLQVSLAPLLGGVLVSAVGARGALAANAATFLLSAACLVRLPALAPDQDGPDGARGFLAATREGLAYTLHHPYARAIVTALFVSVSFAGFDNVALVFLARDTLDTGSLGFGVLVSAFGVGMLLVALVLAARLFSIAPLTLFVLGLVLSGVGTLLTGLAPVLGLAVVAQAVAGAGNQADVIGADTLLQSTVPRPLLGRVFGLVGTGAVAGSSIAALAGGLLLSVASPRVVFVIAGAGVLLALPLALVLAAGARRPSGRE
jgi:MFS family permease